MKIFYPIAVLVLLSFFFLPLVPLAQTPCWDGDLTVDESNPLAYCELITFTFTLDNSCTASSAYNVLIEWPFDRFQIYDSEELPGATYDPGDSETAASLTWVTPTLNVDEVLVFDLVLIATIDILDNLNVRYLVKRTSESIYINHVETLVPDFLNYVDGPASASELIDEYWQGGPLILLLTEDEQSTGVSLACDPESTHSLFISGGLDIDLGTQAEPAAYCIHDHTGSSLVKMGEGSYIRIKSYNTLVLEELELRGCQKMWKGIIVEKNAKLVLRNCTIRDAQYAIEAERGATVECFNNTFVDNYIGIYIAPMPTVQVGNPPVPEPEPFEDAESSYVNMIRFYGNTFTATGTMLSTYESQDPTPGARPFAGIHVADLSFFRVSAMKTVETLVNNTFDGLVNGFVGERVNFMIDKAVFKDIVEDPNSSYAIEGYGVHTEGQKLARIFGAGGTEAALATFDNCKVGVHSESGGIVVRYNNMVDTEYGIVLKRSIMLRTHILDNAIESSMTGIQVSHGIPLGEGTIAGNVVQVDGDPDKSACVVLDNLPVTADWEVINNLLKAWDARYGLLVNHGAETLIRNNSVALLASAEDDRFGIYLSGTKAAEVGCNQILGDASLMNSKLNVGLYLSGAAESLVTCNEVSTCRFGINATGLSDGSDVRGNEIGTNWDGLLMGRFPDDGNAVIGDQVHQGNEWPGTYTHYGAEHYGSQLILDRSKFLVDEDENSDYNTTVLASGDWFYDEDDQGTTFVCNESQECPEGVGYQGLTPVWTELDTAIAAGYLGFEQHDTSLSWIGQLHTYRRLKAWAGQISLPQVLEDFLDDNRQTNIGKFSNVFDSLSVAYVPGSTRAGDLNDWLDDLDTAFAGIAAYDSLLYDDPEDTTYLAGLDSVLLAIYNTTEEYGDTAKALMAKALVMTGNAYDILDNITSSDTWQTDLRDVLKEVIYYLDESQAPDDTLLAAVANACPDAQGDAVFIARSRLGELGMASEYDDYDLCDTGGSHRVRGDMPVTSYFKVWPNPSSKSIDVKADNAINVISIYDMTGKLMQSHHVSDENVELDLHNLDAGIYVVLAVLEDGREVSKKIVIQ